METITTPQQIRQVEIDVRARMRHHAPAVRTVGRILARCILNNPLLRIEARKAKDMYGYSYKITAPRNGRMYITYDHAKEIIFIKNKLRNYEVIHEFDNNASEMQIIAEVRRFVS